MMTMRRIRDLFWPAAAIAYGIALATASSWQVAEAMTGRTSGNTDGLGWRDLAMMLIALISLAAGISAAREDGRRKELSDRVTRLAEDLHRIDKDLAGEYHDKDEMRQVLDAALAPVLQNIAQLNASASAIHSRLDAAGYPARHARQDGEHH